MKIIPKIRFVPCVITEAIANQHEHNLNDELFTEYLLEPKQERLLTNGLWVSDGTIYIQSGQNILLSTYVLLHELQHHFIGLFFGEDSKLHDLIDS